MTSPILKAMRERARERAERWKPIKLRKLPDPTQLSERAILGSYSFTLQVNRIRLLRLYSLIEVDEGLQETPSAIARDYLILTYRRSPKILHSQAVKIGAWDDPEEQDVEKKHLKPFPLYASPRKYDNGFYIDIESTFWSIMKIAGWNVDYYPNEWLAKGKPPTDFPFPNHKQARSCLVSVARPGFIQCWDPNGKTPKDKFPKIKATSQIVNLSISKLISDVLNSIAQTAVDMGAIYANTDGYIVTTERQAAAVSQMVMDWGLTPRLKAEGRGAVKGSGSYKVGETISIPYTARGVTPEEVRNLYAPDYSKWLQKRFAKIAA